jgi:membrane-bound inhibitor of C-type lysozyme
LRVGLIIVIAVAGLAWWQSSKNHIKATFNCDGGKAIKAVFNNGKNQSVDLTLSDGRKMNLPAAISANGARYANAGETVVFWNVGDGASLDENSQTTFPNCTSE